MQKNSSYFKKSIRNKNNHKTHFSKTIGHMGYKKLKDPVKNINHKENELLTAKECTSEQTSFF